MKKKSKIFVILVGVFIIGFVGYKGFQFYHKMQLKKDFNNMVTTIDACIQEWVKPYFNDYDLVNNIEVKSATTFEYTSRKDWYEWRENFNIDIFVDDSFDNYSEKEQYEYLDKIGDFARSTVFNEVDSRYPDYNRYHGVYVLQDEVFGKYVSTQKNEVVRVLTEKNIYECPDMLDNYFVKNGKDVYLRDENGDWDSGLSSGRNLVGDDTTENVTNESELASCWSLAQNEVKSNLKSPSTAEFPSSYFDKDVVITRTGKYYVVSSWVDSQNSFGAILRSRFSVVLIKEGVGEDAKYVTDSCLIE